MAAAWAAGRLSPRDLRQLDPLVGAMGKAVADGNPHDMCAPTTSSISSSIAPRDRSTLLSIIEGLWLQVSPYFHLLHGIGQLRHGQSGA